MVTVKLINGNEIRLNEYTIIKVKKNAKETNAKFYIIENSICEALIGRVLYEKITSKTFPIECSIPTKGESYVAWTRPIKGDKNREEFQALVDKLEKQGVVQEGKSLWLNPVVLTRKTSGEMRFCIDLQRVNDLVELDNFDLPNIQESVRSLHGMEYFSILDLKDGYFQVPIRKEDREKTTFKDTRGRLMHFNRLPQGYKNAPALFQRGMTIILKGLLFEKCLVYIDDIIIFGKSKEEHEKNLSLVKERLDEYGLEINEKKSQLLQTEIKFLGYNISKNCIKPLTSRSEGITQFERPNTMKGLRRFLGMLNYDRMFIKNLAEDVKILYDMLKPNKSRIEWSKEALEAFESVKLKWKNSIELEMVDPKLDFILETDASDIGLGAALKQGNKTCGYISRGLKGAEVNYSITEREVLAAMWAMEKYENYLLGRNFTLITDHKPILEIKTKPMFGTPKIQRWMERLQRFNFEVRYKKGEELIQADAMSRSMHRTKENEVENKIMEIHIESGHSKNIHDKCIAENMIVSKQKIKKVIKEKCQECIKYDNVTKNKGQHIIVNEPGELVGIDLMDINKEKKIILAVDYFSRKAWGRCLDTKDSEKVLKFIEDLHGEFKFKEILTDNGLEFKNAKIDNFCRTNEITRKFSIPHYHQGNGRVERLNRTIREMVKRLKGNLKVKLKKALKAYNSNKHRALGCSPEQALNQEFRECVLKARDKYEKEFSARKFDKLKLGDKVIIKNETKTNKMEESFKDVGEIVEITKENEYIVKLNNRTKVRRHRSQLKIWPGNVG